MGETNKKKASAALDEGDFKYQKQGYTSFLGQTCKKLGRKSLFLQSICFANHNQIKFFIYVQRKAT